MVISKEQWKIKTKITVKKYWSESLCLEAVEKSTLQYCNLDWRSLKYRRYDPRFAMFYKHSMALLQCQCLHILSIPKETLAKVSATYMLLLTFTGDVDCFMEQAPPPEIVLLLLRERSEQDKLFNIIESNNVYTLFIPCF